MSVLTLHNTLGGEPQVFLPLDPQRVTMYVCGPTVYNFIHIGNARPVVVFDVLFRVLRAIYGEEHVVYARNITDVDDKINQAAAANNETISTLTERFTAAYHEDIAQLGALAPTMEPRATDHIHSMIELIGQLLDKGHAYVAEGHVLYAVHSYPRYGRLSGRSLEDMRAGARVEVAHYKRDPHDFILWKPAKPGEPRWDSPWGAGRPGWHLECSAMTRAHLGKTIDIHGGGHDLVFPHHENEIAQSCAAHGVEFARFWIHNGHVTVDGEKMSKSLGNFRLLRDLLTVYPGEVIRLALLTRHYRAPLNFSERGLEQAWSNLNRMYRLLLEHETTPLLPNIPPPSTFFASLLQDLNTPAAIAELHRLTDTLAHASLETASLAKTELLAAAEVLGLLQETPEHWFMRSQTGDPEPSWIETQIELRRQARSNKDFATADRIRDELAKSGIQLEDSPQGTRWRREGIPGQDTSPPSSQSG